MTKTKKVLASFLLIMLVALGVTVPVAQQKTGISIAQAKAAKKVKKKKKAKKKKKSSTASTTSATTTTKTS